LREGKRGGGQSASGPVRRRWPEAGGTTVPFRPMAARATEVGDEQGSGPSGLRRPVGQLGWSVPRRPGGACWAGTE
jgi:hypothetical protein